MAKERLLKEEAGFSLPEMMTTIVIMIVVFFALHSIFDMSLRVFSFGNNKVEAVESARLGLERMEREIRQAYAPTSATELFDTWASTQIRFGNDLDGNGTIQCPNTATPAQCEKVGYQVYETAPGSGNYALGRDNTSAGTTNTAANLQPVIEHMDYVDSTNSGLRLTYCQRLTGADTVTNDHCPSGFNVAVSEANIDMVRVDLRVRVNEGLEDATQTLSTGVDLRNRGST